MNKNWQTIDENGNDIYMQWHYFLTHSYRCASIKTACRSGWFVNLWWSGWPKWRSAYLMASESSATCASDSLGFIVMICLILATGGLSSSCCMTVSWPILSVAAGCVSLVLSLARMTLFWPSTDFLVLGWESSCCRTWKLRSQFFGGWWNAKWSTWKNRRRSV